MESEKAIPKETPKGDVIDNVVDEVSEYDPEPLFEEESVSEEELMGEEVTEENAADSAPKDEPKEDPGEKPKEEPKEEEKPKDEPKEEPKEEPEEEPKAPPKGYVPQEALRQERHTNQELRQQLRDAQYQLQQAHEKLTQKPKDPDDIPSALKNFKELSLEEYDELVDEDPDEAMKYRARLDAYRDYQHKQMEKAQR